MRQSRPQYAKLSPEQRRRSITRSYTAVLVRRRQLARGPCEVCGAGAQAHHLDYGDPRKVMWLCAVHRRQKLREEADRADDLGQLLAELKSTSA